MTVTFNICHKILDKKLQETFVVEIMNDDKEVTKWKTIFYHKQYNPPRPSRE
jgi:hypothetical protein